MRILALDIETTPNLVYVWGLWNQDIGTHKLVEETRMLCFAAKWLGGKRVMFFSEEKDGREAMVKAAHELLNEADVVMTYNGKRFDVPHLQREFLEAGLKPPAPYDQIDLFQVGKQFRFPSHKLDYITKRLELAGKIEHAGFSLWTRCMAGDKKAWKQMREYNVQDVELLEKLYEIMQPWIKNHPNRNLHSGQDGCPRCGSARLVKRGVRRTQVSVFQRYRCEDCGSWSSGTKREAGTTRKCA